MNTYFLFDIDVCMTRLLSFELYLLTFKISLASFISSAFVTHEDICRCFHGETMLTVQAPSGTQLEVPIPDGVRIVELDDIRMNFYLLLSAINYW